MPMHCILQPGLPETAVAATGQGSFCTAMTGIYFIFIFIFMIHIHIFIFIFIFVSARRDAWMIFDLAMTIIYFIFALMIYSFINVNVFKFYVLLLLLHSINLFLLFFGQPSIPLILFTFTCSLFLSSCFVLCGLYLLNDMIMIMMIML